MCGRFVPAAEAAIERVWEIKKGLPAFPPRWNVAPGAIVPLLRLDAAGRLEVVPARWGLIPHWWKGEKPPQSAFNARLEDAAVRPMWRDALRRSRCLVPAQGWYEWRTLGSAGGARPVKQPYFIHRPDGEPIAFAGIAAAWRAPGGGEWTISCAIMTLPAVGALAFLHERMPAALPREAEGAWLSRDLRDGAAAADLLRNVITAGGLSFHPVSRRVNSAQVEGPDLIEPVTGDQ